jgi:hypothetical protein
VDVDTDYGNKDVDDDHHTFIKTQATIMLVARARIIITAIKPEALIIVMGEQQPSSWK